MGTSADYSSHRLLAIFRRSLPLEFTCVETLSAEVAGLWERLQIIVPTGCWQFFRGSLPLEFTSEETISAFRIYTRRDWSLPLSSTIS